MSHLFEKYSDHERKMYLSAYETITRLEAWEFLKHYNPPKNTGFMGDSNPEIVRIENEIHIAYGFNHSGCSMACTMRLMQQIAQNNEYNVTNIVPNNR